MKKYCTTEQYMCYTRINRVICEITLLNTYGSENKLELCRLSLFITW